MLCSIRARDRKQDGYNWSSTLDRLFKAWYLNDGHQAKVVFLASSPEVTGPGWWRMLLKHISMYYLSVTGVVCVRKSNTSCVPSSHSETPAKVHMAVPHVDLLLATQGGQILPDWITVS